MPIAILLAACLREFGWQLAPVDIAGEVLQVSEWLLIVTLCLAVMRHNKNIIVWASCISTAIMSSATAICASWWIIDPWPVIEGAELCSQKLAFPMMLVSALAALLAVSVMRD